MSCMPFFIVNIFLGFSGFLLSGYIAHKKRQKKEHFVCPLRGNCHAVIHSDYSKFFGLSIEYLGMFYYALIAIGYGLLSTFADLNRELLTILFFVSTFALVFSFYLTFLQIFTLRKFCTWCLTSAALTLGIFVLSLNSSFDFLVLLLAVWKLPILILHVTAMAMGLGAATLADLFFFKFLKDYRISEMEQSVLKTFSQFIWLSLGLIVMTGLALFLPQQEFLLQSDKFLMKMIIVAVMILNGAVLNLYIAPRFLQLQFGKHAHIPGELVRTRKFAFLLGSISIVSWYSAFVLGMLASAPASFEVMWRVYLAMIICAVLVGQFLERFISSQARNQASV